MLPVPCQLCVSFSPTLQKKQVQGRGRGHAQAALSVLWAAALPAQKDFPGSGMAGAGGWGGHGEQSRVCPGPLLTARGGRGVLNQSDISEIKCLCFGLRPLCSPSWERPSWQPGGCRRRLGGRLEVRGVRPETSLHPLQPHWRASPLQRSGSLPLPSAAALAGRRCHETTVPSRNRGTRGLPACPRPCRSWVRGGAGVCTLALPFQSHCQDLKPFWSFPWPSAPGAPQASWQWLATQAVARVRGAWGEGTCHLGAWVA